MAGIVARFRSLPRAARWGLLFAAFVVAYFGVVEPVIDLTARLDAAADRAGSRLSTYSQQAEARKAQSDKLTLGVKRFGDVRLPDTDSKRANEVFSKISETLKARNISKPSITQNRGVPLGKDTLQGLLEPNQEVQRLVFELKLEGSLEDVAGVIADLEKIPEVTSIGQVVLRRMGKEEERKLQATVTPEVWIIAERGGRR
jgi:hypothetical protein